LVYLLEINDKCQPWYPNDNRIRARIDRFLHWRMTNIFSRFTKQLLRKILGPMNGLIFPQEEIEYFEKTWKKMYEMMEAWLSENEFLCASHMTMADVIGYEEIAHCRYFLA
jgi:glutathione S-transferase